MDDDEDPLTIGFAQASGQVFRSNIGAKDIHIELAVTGYAVPDPAGLPVMMEITGSASDFGTGNVLEGVNYEGDGLSEFSSGTDVVTILPGASAQDNPRFTLQLPRRQGSNQPTGIVTFTLPDSVTLDDGRTLPADTNAKTHTLTIEPSGGLAGLSIFSGSVEVEEVDENAGSIRLTVDLFSASAPSTGLPMKIMINGNDNEIVSFDDESIINEHNFEVPAGMNTYSVPVHINNNEDFGANGRVIFGLDKDTGFPDEWGAVAIGAVNNLPLDILDDEALFGFAEGESEATEGAANTEHRVPVNFASAPAGSPQLKINVTNGGESDAATQDTDFTVPASLEISQSGDTQLVIQILPDTLPELDEIIILEIPGNNDDNGLPAGFRLGANGTHEVTILANDNTVGLVAPTPDMISEEGGVTMIVANINGQIPAGVRAAIEITPTGATSSDYTLSVPAGDGMLEGGSTWVLPTQKSTSSLVITATGNSDVEPHKTLTLALSRATQSGEWPTGWSVDSPSYDITLVNDDIGSIGFTEGASTATEGDNNAPVQIPVSVSPTPTNAFNINVEALTGAGNSTAVEGDDFTVSSTFNVTGTGDEIEVVILPDMLPEDKETIVLEISAGSGFPDEFAIDASKNKHTITIGANDNTVVFAGNAPNSVTEGDTGVSIEVTLSNPAPADGLALQLEVTGDSSSSTSVGDEVSFDANSVVSKHTFMIDVGDSSASIPLYFPSDSDTDSDTVTLTLTADADTATFPVEWGTAPNVMHDITVNEPASTGGTIEFVAVASTVEEPDSGNQSHTVNINVTGTPPAPANAFDLDVAVAGSAVLGSGNDWVSTQLLTASSPVSISSDNTNISSGVLSLDFDIRWDGIPEPEETIELTLSLDNASIPSGAGTWTLGTNRTHTITIPAHDNIFTLSNFSPSSGGEGGHVSIALQSSSPLGSIDKSAVLRINATGEGIDSGDFSITPENASVVFDRGSDATGGGTLTIPTGTIMANDVFLRIDFTGGDGPEYAETLNLALDGDHSDTSLPTGWGIGAGVTSEESITIPANENIIKFANSSGMNQKTSTTQETAGTHNVPVYANLPYMGGNIVLDVMTRGTGTHPATGGGTDYSVLSQITIDNGASTADIPVVLTNDNDYEEDETFEIVISAMPGALPHGWTIDSDNNTHTVTIMSEDAELPSGTVGFASGNDATATEGEPVQLRIASSGAPAAGSPVIFGWSVSSAAEVDTASGTVTITNPSTEGTFTINIAGDGDAEANEDIEITLTDQDAMDLFTLDESTKTHTITILANENTAAFATNNPDSVLETVGMTTLNIAITNPAPTGGLDLVITAMGATSAVSFDQNNASADSLNFTIPASHDATTDYPITVYISDGIDNQADNVTFTLTQNSTTFPNGWGSVPANETHDLSITEPPVVVSGTVAFDKPSSTIEEPAEGMTTPHTVDIVTTGTLPSSGSFTLTVNTDTQSTAGADDYTATETLSSVQVSGIGKFALNFSILPDTIPENDETIVLTLSSNGLPEGGGGRWNLGSIASHTITILANDSSIGFSSQEPSKLAEQSAFHMIPVQLSAPGPQNIDLTASITGGREYDNTAITPTSSEVVIGGMVNFRSNVADEDPTAEGYQQTAHVSVRAVADSMPENEETFVMRLQTPSGGLTGFTRNFEHTIIIPAHDNTITFESTPPDSVTEEGSAVTVNLELTNPVPVDYTVIVTQAGADSGDLTINPASITIPMGQDAASFTITANDDTDLNPETVRLTLSSSQVLEGWEVPPSTTHDVRIIDNDIPTATIGFVGGASMIAEPDMGSSSRNVEFSISGKNGTLPAGNTLDVMLTIELGAGVTEGSNGDVTFSRTLQIDSSEFDLGTLNHSVTVYSDDDMEEDETVTIKLTDAGLPPGWILGAIKEHIITIPQNDQPVTPTIGFAQTGAMVQEPASGTGNVVHNVPLALTVAPSADVTVAFTFSTANGADNNASGNDYSATATHLIRVSEISSLMASYPVTVIEDDVPELLRSFTIRIPDTQPDLPSDWMVDSNNNEYLVEIPANDNTVEFASAGPVTITEFDGNDHSVDIDITINNPLPSGTSATVTVMLAAVSTADAMDYTITGTGYDPATGILTLPAAQGTATFKVTAVGEDAMESGEHFTLELASLSGADGWSIGAKDSIRFDITDDTPAVTGAVGFGPTDIPGGINLTSVSEGNSLRLAVIASVMPDMDIPINWQVTSGDEDVTPDSGTVTIKARENIVSFDIMVEDDDARTPAEADEEITVTLSGGLIHGFTFDDKEHTFTIPANEQNTIGFATAQPETAPLEGDDVTLMLRIRDAGGTELMAADIINNIPLTFTYTESDNDGNPDTASSSPESFTVTSSVTVTDGVLNVTPPVTIEDDEAHETPETVTIELGMGESFPSEWLIDGNNDTFTITIPANDVPPVENKIGFSQSTFDLYTGGPQSVTITESMDTPFASGIHLVATIDDTDVVSFHGQSNTQKTLDVMPVATETSASLAISAAQAGGTTNITLSEAPSVMQPPGWQLDGNRSILTVNTYERTVAFAESETEALLTAGTVPVRLDFGAPAPAGFEVTVTTSDTETITLPTQPMQVTPGVRFHEFDVTIVEAASESRIDRTASLSLGTVTETGGNTWNASPDSHNLRLLVPEMVLFESFASASVREDAGMVPVRLHLTAPAPNDFSVNFALTDADATTYGSDVSVVAGSGSTFPMGSRSATINLNIVDDKEKEPFGEEVNFTLTKGTGFPNGWELDEVAYTLFIIDNDGDATGTVSFASTNPSELPEGAGLTVMGLSLGGGTIPEEGMGLTLTSSDPSRVAIPERWASFTLPAGTTGSNLLFTVDVLGQDGDAIPNDVTLTLGRGTDGQGAGFPAGWSLTNTTQQLRITEFVRVVGFAEPSPADSSYENFDQTNFRISVAESSGKVVLPIRTNLSTAQEGGLPLTVTIAQGGDVFSFTQAPEMTSYSFAIPKDEKEYNLEISIAEDNDTDIDVGRFVLSLGANPPDDFSNRVTRDEITVWSIDDDGEEEGFVVFEGATESPFGSPVEYFEPYIGDADAFTDSNGHTTAIRYVNLLFSALPRPTTTSPRAGFNLEATFSSQGSTGAAVNQPSDGSATPDIMVPTLMSFFIPIDEIQIRSSDFLYRLPFTVYSEATGHSEEEREGFKIEIVENQEFPPGIAGRRFPYNHLGTIIDRSGGQIHFGDRDVTNGSDTLNPSRVTEGDSFNARIHATRTNLRGTSVSWRIERAVDADGTELSNTDDLDSTGGMVTINTLTDFMDIPITVTDDNIAEGDETYTLIIEEGSGFPSGRGGRIDPERNRYTFTIRDNDFAPLFAFGGASTEAEENGSEITIPFSLTEGGTANNSLIPAGGICLILEVSGDADAFNDDVFHVDTSRSAATTSPATPNCEPTRGTSGAVNTAIGTGTTAIAEYIPAGQNPEMRLRINDDETAEHKEEITFTIRGANNGLPGVWQIGQRTHTVAIAANDNLIKFAEKTSSLTENTTDLPDQPAMSSREVTVNISRAVPEEAIMGPDKEISIQVGIATLNGTGTGDDITLAVAQSASGSSSFDPMSSILTVDAGIDEVPLVITAVDDEIRAETAEQVTITLSEVGGTPLPSGWSVDTTNGNNVHTVSVADNDFVFVQFAEEFKDGFTINENADWDRRRFVTITDNAIVPRLPNMVAAHKTFSVRLRVDSSDLQFGYVGITERRPENASYDSGKTFQEQGYSQTTLDFYNNGFGSSLHVRNGLMSIRTSQNGLAEGPQDVKIFLEIAPGYSLPPGWRIGERDTLTVTVSDNENFIRWADTGAGGNPTEFTEGQGPVQLKLYASDGGVSIGSTTTQTPNSFARLLRLHDGEVTPVPMTDFFSEIDPKFGIRFPKHRVGNSRKHFNDVYANFDGSGGHTKVIASRYFPAPDLTFNTPENLNNGQPYTLLIGEDNNFTDDVFIYEIYQVSLSNSGWGSVLGHPLQWRFTIRDNDQGGIISFAERDSSVAEGSSVPVTISIVQPLQVESSVVLDLSADAGKAVYGTDYTITGTGGAVYDPGTSALTLPANMRDVRFTVQTMPNSVTGDISSRLDKEFTITLSQPTGGLPTNWTVSSTENTHTVSIVDNDIKFGFVEQSTTVFEKPGSGTTVDIAFQVTGATVPAGGFYIPMEITGEDNSVLRGTQSVKLSHYNVLREAENDDTALNNIVGSGDDLFIRSAASSGGNPRFTITIPDDAVAEPGGTITFTLPASLTSVSGASRTHELKIEPSDGRIFFTGSQNSSTRPEGSGKHTVLVQFDRDSGAPSGGLPLKLEITSSNDNNLVTFNMDGTPNNVKDFIVPAGQTEQEVELYINDNSSGAANPPVILTIMKGDNFPNDWGPIEPLAKIHTLTVTNEDPPTIGFASAGQVVSEGVTAKVSFEFAGYTIPSQGVTLEIDVEGSSNANITGNTTLLDANYPGSSQNGIPNRISLNLSASDNADPSFDIVILQNTPSGGEEDEILTFTLQNNLPSGTNLGISEHRITIPANGNVARFSSASDMVNEDVVDGMTTLPVSLFRAGAPTDGLPLKIDIAPGSEDIVTFNSDKTTADNSHTFTVGPGKKTDNVIVYIINNSDDADPDNQEVVFTLSADTSNNFPAEWGSVDTSNNQFTLTVVDDDNTVTGGGFFGNYGGAANEDAGMATINVQLTDASFNPIPAPSGGLPLKLEIVDSSGNITTSNLVTFNSDGTTPDNSGTFRVPAGMTEHDVPVYIIDNSIDEDPDRREVNFKLSADNSNNDFPAGWEAEVGLDIGILYVTDDDNSAGSPPRLPDPIRPPTQETSPKPDEFQKKAEVNP
ncbi:MAG: hypothetical protein OXF05_00055 [Hyphomicrobiales bacterium]|nr:hypothetical protein [Hyphomicrobiales bacterium]